MNALTVEELARLHGTARREALEDIYTRFNHPGFRESDPVAFVWGFTEDRDREIAAWAAAALAYGRVASIRAALADLDRRWEGRPADFLSQTSLPEKRQALRGFVYRWTRDHHLLGHLTGFQAVHADTPLPERLASGVCPRPGGYRAALIPVVRDIRGAADEDPGHLLPDPAAPSACKRLAMWLRWMTRRDNIDPGLWADTLDPAGLWVPLDTHMFRISRRLGLTRRRTADAEAARRITAAYARVRPDDPVRYDFAITRLGMGTD